MVGLRFGRLFVEALKGRTTRRRSIWTCLCDCGQRVNVEGSNLRAGNSRSCGCLHAEELRQRCTTHGHGAEGNRSPEYESWCAMWARVRDTDPTSPRWKNYGSRGIGVCPRWESFDAFLADMGSRPSSDHSIDRIDNDGNYEPGNCRWSTASEQNANQRRSRKYRNAGDGHQAA